MQTDALRKDELRRLIRAGGDGDVAAARRLISPFVSADEKLICYGISAQFGLIATYDFFFLTDRRVGDLQVTPFTGALNVEVAYLNKIDSFVISQPAIPVLLRLVMAVLYLAAGLGCGFGGYAALWVEAGLSSTASWAGAAAATAAGAVFVHWFLIPAIRRSYLKFKKSGVWFKLTGSRFGILIFADRHKFSQITALTRAVSEAKRHADRIT